MLQSRSTIVHADAERLFGLLCEHFAEHGEVVLAPGRGQVSFGYGTTVLSLTREGLAVEVEAGDQTGLSFLKSGVADHIAEFCEGEAPAIVWRGDGLPAGAPLPYFRELTLVGSWALTPHMRRVRLKGRDLAAFAGNDYHVYLLFPPEGRAPVWPVIGESGLPVWPQGEDKLARRVYTIRRIDAERGELEVDIVLHEGEATPGSTFALQAEAGAIVGMVGPGGGGAPKARSMVLVGDDTALPAIARILETLGEEARATVLLEVDGPADEIALCSKARLDLRVLHRRGAEPGTTAQLPAALRALDWEALGPEVFVWAGCEFDDFKAIRRYLRKERALPRERHLAVAYWRRGTIFD